MHRTGYVFFRLLSYVLSVCLAFTLALSASFAIVSLTGGNRNYTRSYFTDGTVVQSLSDALYAQLAETEQQYNLKSGLLQDAYSSAYLSAVQESAMNTIYNGTAASVSDSMDIERRCRYALAVHNANAEKQEKLTAAETEEITQTVCAAFSAVYDIDNSEMFFDWLHFFAQANRLFALFAVASVGLAAVIYFASGRRHLSWNFHAMALVTAGGLLVLLPLLFAHGSTYRQHPFTPVAAYNTAIVAAITDMLYISIGIGVVLWLFGAMIFLSNHRYYAARFSQSDAEREIEKNLL